MRPLLFALAVLAATPALAQTVTFRSGNHEDFARLVLDIPPGTGWTIGRIGADYALELEGSPDFDLSGAFERIPRDRVGAIEISDVPGRIVFRLACACHVSGFLFRPNKLVVDVRDGPPDPGSPWEQPIDGSMTVRTGRTVDAGFPLFGSLPPPDLTFFTPAREPAAELPLSIEDIAEDMARAVAAGLLDAPMVETGLSSAIPEPEDPLPVTPTDVAADRPGVNFITAGSLDRQPEDLRALSRTGRPCLPDNQFDLAAWAPSGDFSADIGVLRAAVIDEAGSPDQDAITALAKAYLHFGFGLEARQTLALSPENSAEAVLIGHLADIIDDRPVPAGVFADQAGCQSAVALWAALSDGSLDGRTEAERTAIEIAHRVLPPGPRLAVTPRLATLFLANGHPEAAAEMMARLPSEDMATEESLGVGSDIVRTAGSAAAAREELLEALRNGSRSGAGTTIRLVDATIDAGLVPEPWMIETLAALRFENRGTDIGTDLVEAEIRARVAAADFNGGKLLLTDEDLARAPQTRTARIIGFAEAIAERGTDSDFLTYVFDEETPKPDPMPDVVAARLLALGFPDVALGMLSSIVTGEDIEARNRLRAEALRALGQEEEAGLLLAGMPDQSGPQEEAAWQSGDWDALRSSADPLLTEAAQARLTPSSTEPDVTLADRSALIAEAQATRELARSLLSRFPEPEGAPPQ